MREPNIFFRKCSYKTTRFLVNFPKLSRNRYFLRFKLLQSKAELAPVLPLTYHYLFGPSVLNHRKRELGGFPLPVPLALHAMTRQSYSDLLMTKKWSYWICWVHLTGEETLFDPYISWLLSRQAHLLPTIHSSLHLSKMSANTDGIL